ncbi:cyclase family protein [Pseudonocardia acaciae]|uniref:cyclase family protein n=1 Tax=Pseudonocardia acaciae TaxID=551276 RepID=UPI00048A5465|nr:cyclase family protein [Pseudonocardia acaciae]
MTRPKYDQLPAADGGARSAWGQFGDDDCVGTINLQTPERIAAAAQLVRRGAVFSLNAPLNLIEPPMYDRGVDRRTTLETRPGRTFDDVHDNFYPQATSQWDSLGHIAFDSGRFYNGASTEDVRAGRRNTIEHWAARGIAGRGVLLDIARTAPAGYRPGTSHAITVAELERAREAAGVEYRTGDILLLHTGFLAWYVEQDAPARKRLAARETLTAAGIEHSEEMAAYLWDSGLSAVAADNPALEVWPPDLQPEAWPFGFLHQIMIGQLGLAIGELWWLADLAQDCADTGVHEFLVTAAPLHARGGIGSPANALALK